VGVCEFDDDEGGGGVCLIDYLMAIVATEGLHAAAGH
jgi:hypothetical protein